MTHDRPESGRAGGTHLGDRLGDLPAFVGRSFAKGTVPVAIGTAVSGLAVYGFLGLTARTLTPHEYAPLSVLWSLVFIIGPGVFIPLEQDVARTVAAKGGDQALIGSAIRRAILLGASAAGAIVVLVAATSSLLGDRLFGGDPTLALALCLAVPGLAGVHLVRGIVAGQGRFWAYGSLVGAEAAIRLGLAAVVVVQGTPTVREYSWVVGASPAIAVIAVVLIARPVLPAAGVVMPWRRLAEGLGYLLVGSLGLQLLINAGPLAVQILAGGSEPAAAGRLLTALVLTRIPLYMFQAVQAALLPGLAASVSESDHVAFRGAVGRLLAVIGGLTVLGVIGAAAVGPWALSVLFGPQYVVGRVDLVLLTLASCTLMAAQTCGAALVSAHRHARSSFGWALGVVAFVALCALPLSLLPRVEVALLGGALTSCVVLAAALASTVRAGRS